MPPSTNYRAAFCAIPVTIHAEPSQACLELACCLWKSCLLKTKPAQFTGRSPLLLETTIKLPLKQGLVLWGSSVPVLCVAGVGQTHVSVVPSILHLCTHLYSFVLPYAQYPTPKQCQEGPRAGKKSSAMGLQLGKLQLSVGPNWSWWWVCLSLPVEQLGSWAPGDLVRVPETMRGFRKGQQLHRAIILFGCSPPAVRMAATVCPWSSARPGLFQDAGPKGLY